jgi:peptide/nickel transport system substrate-binding protein
VWVLGVAAAGCTERQQPSDPNVITVATRLGPNSLNPMKANDEGTARLSQLVFESLMDVGDDLNASPTLAERVETPDPLTYLVHLRRGVTFHDGRAMTSRDVVFTYARFLDPAYVSPHKGAFTVMTGVKAVDDYTVAFTLKEPFPAFPVSNLVPIQVVPEGVDDAALAAQPIGTGPYRFVRYDVDDKVILAPYEGYWNGAPANGGLVLKIVPDDTMRGLEMRKGTADLMINDVPPDIAYQFERTDEARIIREPGLDFSYLGFNMADPVLADARVRQAIGYAIDRDAIVKYLRRGMAQVATGLIPPQHAFYEPDIHTFSYDPERAMRLLDEAGYRDPDGPDGPLPRLRLTLKISTNEEIRLQSTVIQQDLRRVGIDLDVRSYEFATMFADVVSGNFQIMSLIWVGGAMIDPDILRRVFHSQQVPPNGFNRGRYSNPEVDRLLDEASMSLDEAQRRRLYGEAQKIIAADAPYIPIWNRQNVIVSQRTLAGLHINPVGDFASLKDVRRVAPTP